VLVGRERMANGTTPIRRVLARVGPRAAQPAEPVPATPGAPRAPGAPRDAP
jgi:hypothetical protein